MTLFEVYNRFLSFEDRFRLCDHKVQGFRFWDYLRVSIFDQIVYRHGILDKRQKPAPSRGTLARALSRLGKCKHFVTNNPLLSSNHQYLFLGPGTKRRKAGKDETLWDIYCDPIIEHIGQNKCVLLEPHDLFSKSPVHRPHTQHISYTDAFSLYNKIHRSHFPVLRPSPADVQLIRDIQIHLLNEFNIDLDILALIQKRYRSHQAVAFPFDKVLTKVAPKAVFLVCSYGNEAYIECCRRKNIPTIEIQHGTISPFHIGYSYPGNSTKQAFPDYLLTFGRFWEETVNLPIDKSRIFTFGYPYLDEQLATTAKIAKKKQLVLLSQSSLGNSLVAFALKLLNHLPSDWECIYKLHPGEVHDWQNEYPELAASGIQVITREPPSLYELLAESQIQVGVYSTAIFEGLALGCRTYLVNLPGHEHMQPLIDENICTLINNPGEIDFQYINSSSHFNKERFFADSWQDNFNQAMAQIGLEPC